MWNKRRDEEPPKPFSPLVTPSAPPMAANAPAPVTHSVEVKKEITPVSSTPVSRFEPANSSINSIGKSVKVVGQIYSKEDLYVDGTVEGTLEASEHKLTIGPHGTIQASIKAREVLVLGTIQGNVEALERLEIRKDAKLLGDIRTARIVIEDGAYFKGSIDIIKPEPVKASAKPAASAAAPAAAPTPTPTPAAPTAAPVAENRR
jgi:cytoskeletal protein CcmA (bactofilin family)